MTILGDPGGRHRLPGRRGVRLECGGGQEWGQSWARPHQPVWTRGRASVVEGPTGCGGRSEGREQAGPSDGG